MTDKIGKNLLNYNLHDLNEFFILRGEKSFRAIQVFGWLAKGVTDFDDMLNVPRALRDTLKSEGYYIGLPEVARKQKSKDGTIKCLFRYNVRACNESMGAVKPNEYGSDGTVKCLSRFNIRAVNEEAEAGIAEAEARIAEAEARIAEAEAGIAEAEAGIAEAEDDMRKPYKSGALSDGRSTDVESVFMKYDYGKSICISSQAGCRMGCTFCASTMDGLERSLTGGEMLGQVLAMRNLTGEDINHVVVMGMGEPFDNYEELARFIRLIHEPKGYNLSLRNITVSTCGIIPGIRRFAEDFPQVNLAVSLHAPNQEMRQRTMPIAKKYGYDDLMDACREYTELTKRRITFEYALIDGVNDSKECAEELAGRLRGWLTHVNLIPLNEVKGREYRKAAGESVRRFRDTLERCGVAVTVRRTLGADIDAACGQLRRNKQ